MAILRRVLYLDALLCAVFGFAVAAIPRFLLATLFGQPEYPDYAVARLFGVVAISAVVTVAAGVLLYWRSSGGFDLDWITSGTGIGFTLGGLAGISALVLGLVAVSPAVDRMGALGTEMEAGGGTPTEAQAAELHGLEARLRTLGRIDVALLTVAVLAMATARYL